MAKFSTVFQRCSFVEQTFINAPILLYLVGLIKGLGGSLAMGPGAAAEYWISIALEE